MENIKQEVIINEKIKLPRGRPRKLKEKSEKDKEQKALYQKQYYYEENKDKLLSDMKAKVACEKCGKTIAKCNLVHHQQTSKCLENNWVSKIDQVIELNDQFTKLKKKNDKLIKAGKKEPLIETQLKNLCLHIKGI